VKEKSFNIELFKERLRTAREQAGLKQEEFAKRVGMARASASYYENTKNTSLPNAEVLFNMAKVLNCSINYLMGLSDHKMRSTEELLAVDLGLSECAVQNLNVIYKLGKEKGDKNSLARLDLFSEFIAFSSNMLLLDSAVKYILTSLPENKNVKLSFKDDDEHPFSYDFDTAELLNIQREIALNDIGKVLDKIREVGQKTWAEYKSGLGLEGDE